MEFAIWFGYRPRRWFGDFRRQPLGVLYFTSVESHFLRISVSLLGKGDKWNLQKGIETAKNRNTSPDFSFVFDARSIENFSLRSVMSVINFSGQYKEVVRRGLFCLQDENVIIRRLMLNQLEKMKFTQCREVSQ